MKQVWIAHRGNPDSLEVREVPDPVPAPDEVLVRVHVSGVNFADIMTRKGLYPDAPPPPSGLGYEVSGTVEAVGSSVDPAWTGRPVLALTRFNGYAERAAVPLRHVFEKPAGLSFGKAASIPVNYLAAYQSLIVMGSAREGDILLVHNAGSGVGLAAMDLARGYGIRVFGTAAAWKHPFLRERGFEDLFDPRKGPWEDWIMSRTGNAGVDLALDPLGGSHWKRSLKVLAPGGRLGAIGVSEAGRPGLPVLIGALELFGGMPWFNPIGLMNGNRGVFGINLGKLWNTPDRVRGWMDKVLKLAAGGGIDPHIDRTFKLTEASDAHAYIEARKNIGKVLLLGEHPSD